MTTDTKHAGIITEIVTAASLDALFSALKITKAYLVCVICFKSAVKITAPPNATNEPSPLHVGLCNKYIFFLNCCSFPFNVVRLACLTSWPARHRLSLVVCSITPRGDRFLFTSGLLIGDQYVYDQLSPWRRPATSSRRHAVARRASSASDQSNICAGVIGSTTDTQTRSPACVRQVMHIHVLH